jgi:hypothetical protein
VLSSTSGGQNGTVGGIFPSFYMARIRTIKPEFWQNEQLAGISFHARLLAIALLNHADDKGLFLANPQLVRAACFPFEEDSKNVLGSLQELSRIGYIEVRDCSGKQVGRICKFLEHQRIDKPQKSKLVDVFAAKHEGNGDSESVPGIVLEDSGNIPRPEGNGKEGNGSGKEGEREGKHTPPPPVGISIQPEDELAPHWRRWCEYCLAISKPVNEIQADAILMDLGRRGTAKAIRDIDFSIRKSAKSILDSDHDFQKQAGQTRSYGTTPRTRNYT